VKGTQRIADMGGLSVTHPALAWALVISVAAIAGLPPREFFLSEFLVVSSTFARAPLLAIPLVVGLLLAIGALLVKGWRHCVRGSRAVIPRLTRPPLFPSSPFAIVIAAGVWLPGPVVTWFHNIAQLLGLSGDHSGTLRRAGAHPREPALAACRRRCRRLAFRGIATAEGLWELLALWAEAYVVHSAVRDPASGEIAVLSLPCAHGGYTALAQWHPPAMRLERHDPGFVRLWSRSDCQTPSLARSWPLGRESSAWHCAEHCA